MKETKPSLGKIYLWCLSFIFRRYFIYVLLFICLVFVQEYCLLLIPQFIQQFITYVTTGVTSEMTTLLFYLLIAVVAAIVARPLYMLCKMVFCEKGTCDIQYSVVDKARVLGYDYFENTPRGQMLAETYQNTISIYFIYEKFFPEIIISFFAFAIATGRIFSFGSLMLNLLLIVCYILIVSVVIITNKKVFRQGEAATKAKNEFYQQTYDWIESRDEVQVFHAEQWIGARTLGAMQKMFKKQRQLFSTQKKVAGVLAVLQAVVIYILFLFAVYGTEGAALSVGEVVATFLYVMAGVAALITLINLAIEQTGQIASAEKPYLFFKRKPSVVEKSEALDVCIDGDISFKNVTFSYGESTVLDGLDLKISKGEQVAIVGESGSGKTTLLKLLLRYYDIENGILELDGRSIDAYTLSALRKYIGIVFQETFLFSGNVRDNLEFAQPGVSDEQIWQAVELACMDNVFADTDALRSKELSSRGENLSGGERQRLSIARIFLKNPNILLLDEVTSELDSVSEKMVVHNLFRFFKGKTMVMVTHRLSTIQMFDRIIVMNKGKIVQDGSYAELSRAGTFFDSLVNKEVIV